MDEEGYAHFAAIENLASRARVSVEETKAALDAFIAPDPNSSNPENEGRRIEKVPGGYIILNAKLYRELATKFQQKEQTRARVALYRSKNQGKRKRSVTQRYTPLPSVSVSDSVSDSVGGECEGNPYDKISPTIENALAWLANAKTNGADYTEEEMRFSFLKLQGDGFKYAQGDWRAGLERQIQWDRQRTPIRRDDQKSPEANQRHENLTIPRLCPKDSKEPPMSAR